MDMEVKISKINLSLLAQVLAQDAGVQVVAGPHLATDGEKIYIPPGLMGDESAATIIRGGITHEAVGHCRHTDFSVTPFCGNGLVQSVMNVLEDIRIEKASWLCFPGAKRVLEEMAVEVDGLGWFGGPGNDDRPERLVLSALLRDLRSRILCQPLDATKTADVLMRAQAMFGNRWPQIITLAEQGAVAASTADVLVAAEHIVSLLSQPGKPQPQPQPQPSGSESESNESDAGEGASGGGAEGTDSQGDASANSDATSKASDPSNDDPTGTQGDGLKKEGDLAGASKDDTNISDGGANAAITGEDASSSSGSSDQTSEDLPVTSEVCDPGVEIDATLDSALGRFLASDAIDRVWSLNTKVDQGLMELAPRARFERDPSVSLAMRLRNELERLLFTRMQDEDDAIVDRGRLDSTRLVEAMTGSRDVFTREQAEGEALDTEVFILADRSGSTNRFIHSINNAVRGMGGAMSHLEGSHLTFGIWYFDDVLEQAKRPEVRWRTDMDRCWASARNGTDWLSSFTYLMPKLAKSRRTRKVFYTITDGDLGRDEDAEAAIRAAKMSGIDLVFLRINPESPEPTWFKRCNNVSASSVDTTVDGLNGLHRAIFRSLQQALMPN